jgi:O-antigen ligase
VVLALAIIFFGENKFSKRYLSILIFIFLALLFILKDTAKFQDFVSFDDRSSLASRVMIWESAGKILTDNYVLGIGPGNFQAKYLEYQKFFPLYLQWAVPHPHNIFLAFWLSTGLIGFFSFLGILYLFFRKSIPGIKFNDAVNVISLGIIIYFLLHGLVDTTYFKNDLAVIFWLAILF